MNFCVLKDSLICEKIHIFEAKKMFVVNVCMFKSSRKVTSFHSFKVHLLVCLNMTYHFSDSISDENFRTSLDA